MKKFESLNGKIIKRKILDLKELRKEGYDVVINCSGLGAAELVEDHLVAPIRGQISKVNWPLVFQFCVFTVVILKNLNLIYFF